MTIENGTARNKSNDNRRYRRERRAEHRDYFKHCSYDREDQRMRHLKYCEAEIHKHPHQKTKQKLPLHPQTNFVLRTFPKTEYIVMLFLWDNDAQKIIHARFKYCKIK